MVMQITDRNLLQVTKLSKGRTLACNQGYFGNKGDIYYAFINYPEQILMLTKTPPEKNHRTMFIREYGQKAGNQRSRVFTLCKEFCSALDVTPGVDFVTVREAMDGFAIQKSKEKEIAEFGTKTHRKALLSGEVRGHSKPYLYLTKEQKNAIGIGTHTTPVKMTVNIATGGYIRLSPLEEDDSTLPTYVELKSLLGDSLFKKEFTCKYNFCMCLNFPAPIRKAMDINHGDIMPVYIEDGSVVIERKGVTCDVCGRNINARKEKATFTRVCKPCIKATEKESSAASETATPLQGCGLSNKSTNALLRMGLRTVEDLADLDLEKFAMQKAVGAKTVAEVKAFMNFPAKNSNSKIKANTTPLCATSLSMRVISILLSKNLRTVSDLATVDFEDLAKTNGAGKKVMKELNQFIEDLAKN